jgi:hypothetical protein
MSVSDQIRDNLQTNWGLGGTLAVGNLYFGVGWFNGAKALFPQVTVYPLMSPEMTLFGPSANQDAPLHSINWERYVVNVWREVKTVSGETEELQAEQMRREAVRILLDQYRNYSNPVGAVFPRDEGLPRHETATKPRRLRYEITCQANYKR